MPSHALVRSAAAIWVTAVALAGCSFAADYAGTEYRCGRLDECPQGFRCAEGVCVAARDEVDAGGDAATRTGTWTSGGAEGFAGGSATDLIVAPRGALEPAAYYTGGVLAAGATGVLGANPTWAEVLALPASPARSIARNADLSWAGVPTGLGLTVADGWTVWLEGELWLDAGDWTFRLDADDRALVELAAPGGAFARIVTATSLSPVTGTFRAETAGWYAIRWAVSDLGGPGAARIRYQGPGTPSLVDLPRDRLRARADQLRGLVTYAFDGERFGGDRAITIDATAPADVDWDTGAPTDLGLSSGDDWSLRWAGQVYLDTGGTYAFRYQSDDGQRLWLDGVLISSRWDGQAHDETTAPVTLEAGWHDVVIDLSERVRRARALLSIASGPGAGAALPVDRLRPVEGRGERYEHLARRPNLTIPDAVSGTSPGVADATASSAAPAGATANGVELTVAYTHGRQGDLRIALVAPSGRVVVLREPDATTTSGSFVEYWSTTALDGEPAGGTWTVRFTDIAPGAAGTVDEVQLTVHTRGAGQPPIATEAVYVSPVRAVDPGSTITAVRWTARTPTGTGAAIFVRTGADADAVASAPWVGPLADPTGATAPAVPAGGAVQYRVELTSDGDRIPSLESLAIDHRAP